MKMNKQNSGENTTKSLEIFNPFSFPLSLPVPKEMLSDPNEGRERKMQTSMLQLKLQQEQFQYILCKFMVVFVTLFGAIICHEIKNIVELTMHHALLWKSLPSPPPPSTHTHKKNLMTPISIESFKFLVLLCFNVCCYDALRPNITTYKSDMIKKESINSIYYVTNYFKRSTSMVTHGNHYYLWKLNLTKELIEFCFPTLLLLRVKWRSFIKRQRKITE